MVTIADVARAAGVAPSTVSYVLNGKRSISEPTRKRVLESVRQLGYQPHTGARALASNRSDTIALVLPLRAGMDLLVLMQFAVSVVTTARAYDQHVLLVTADEGAAGLERLAAGSTVDGLIVMDVEVEDARVPALRALPCPSVLIGFPRDSEGLTCVDLDFRRAGALCVEHLAEQGHRHIALLGAPQAVYNRATGFAQGTLTGFQEAVKQHDLTAWDVPCEQGYDAVRETVERLLRQDPELTGFVIHNEAAVGPLLEALRAHGKSVPEDVSVVAICPDEVAERSSPPLTSVLVPAGESARRAVTLLMEKRSGTQVPQATLLTPWLTVRGSTGPAPV
ncbi:LacI family DNA-binding transcriptional regulator [Allostreptomyces psammosilenae]|uniref:DNA-binding LacI/PurR family transcriptional regulator n=1 Tax=Allostreptomyces psammosilenae TaxID=1892865 RepID=A0A852ZSD9_9ACTN|nr:LacI family DNA-binding transcriptional regulator [Allostreptomyces psammosilenae]NYI04407.1 DNA-binding LacI/PurR family transcriptional regulator [Allostreptomyces psammosilenae]